MVHEWKFGDWGVTQCRNAKIVRHVSSVVDGDRKYNYFVHSDGHIFHQPDVSFLSDCTGWDWQPPKPKPKYRPFANAAEFMPHRDRWVKFKGSPFDGASRVRAYSELGVDFIIDKYPYDKAFEMIVFEDGSPFGVCDGRT